MFFLNLTVLSVYAMTQNIVYLKQLDFLLETWVFHLINIYSRRLATFCDKVVDKVLLSLRIYSDAINFFLT